MKTTTLTQAKGTKAMVYETFENRMYEIRFTDGTTIQVEAMSTLELREKALGYYKAKNGEVDFHWVQVGGRRAVS